MSVRREFSGQKLRDGRKDARLSRTVLAFGVGVTVDSIGNYERGDTTPSAKILGDLAEHLECSVDDFFEVEEVVDA